MEKIWYITKCKFNFNLMISDLEYNLIKAFLDLLFKSKFIY